MPKLQRAKTVACGLLRWDRCWIIVVSHWSKPAGQNMASLLVVVGFRTSHSMPKEESHVIFSKNLPLKARECPGSQGLRDALPLGQMDWQHAPLDPAFGHIQDGREHGSPPQGARAATACGGGGHLCDTHPLLLAPLPLILCFLHINHFKSYQNVL